MLSAFELKHKIASQLGRLVDLDMRVQKARQRYIVCYHRVLTPQQAAADYVHDAMWVSPETFEQQIHWMLKVGEIVDYRRILDFGQDNDRPLFTITFDDGWKDNYEVAFSILKQYSAPALIFLATGAVESGRLFWPEDVVTRTHHAAQKDRLRTIAALDALQADSIVIDKSREPAALAEELVESLKLVSESERKQRIEAYYGRLGDSSEPLNDQIMNWDEVNRMQEKGICFGSHTHGHKILRELPNEEVESEVRLSYEVLKKRLGREVDTFAYPNARYRGNEGEILARVGYRFGFRLHNKILTGDYDPYLIPRLISYESIAANADFYKMRLLNMPLYTSS